MMELNRIYNEDCLEGMKRVPDGRVDCIISDLPYGTTWLDWDKRLPLGELWEQYGRVIKKDGAIILFAQQPFTSLLIQSNIEIWRYNWIWVKDNGTNFLNSHYQPIKKTEDICVFSKSRATYSRGGGDAMAYFPQFSKGNPYVCRTGLSKPNSVSKTDVSGFVTVNDGYRYPTNILEFKRDKTKMHPTQKPVALIEYLIRTYTLPGELVLDSCMGSGTTAVACINTNRNYVGFELDKRYYDMATDRIRRQQPKLEM